MELNEPNSFFDVLDEFKKNHPVTATNLFHDARNIKSILDSKKCRLYLEKNTLFLLELKHEKYFDCYYLTSDIDELDNDIKSFLLEYPAKYPIRMSIIGMEPATGNIANIFEHNGFILIKKLLRIRLQKLKKNNINIIETMKELAQAYLENAGFAKKEDAAEIMEMLKEEFDIVGDNIPELSEIENNIEKNQVVIIRIDGKVAALHYFTIKNNILHGLFDLTRKEYRGAGGLIFAINVFEDEYYNSHNINLSRIYGWRDEKKTRLVKSSKKTNGQPDGVVIYNMLWEPQPSDNNI